MSGAERLPAAVTRFLRANRAYTRKYEGRGLPPERAYLRFRVGEDWRRLRPHLPRRVAGVLELGCGVGGLALRLYRGLGRPRLTLVDKSRREQGRDAFDVLGAARAFLAANRVPAAAVTTLGTKDPDLHGRLQAGRWGLVVSLRALGYMFPYAAYRPALRRALAPGGRLVLDVRLMDEAALRANPVIHGRFGRAGFPTHRQVLAALRRDFGSARVIGRSRDYLRVLAVRPRRRSRRPRCLGARRASSAAVTASRAPSPRPGSVPPAGPAPCTRPP